MTVYFWHMKWQTFGTSRHNHKISTKVVWFMKKPLPIKTNNFLTYEMTNTNYSLYHFSFNKPLRNFQRLGCVSLKFVGFWPWFLVKYCLLCIFCLLHIIIYVDEKGLALCLRSNRSAGKDSRVIFYYCSRENPAILSGRKSLVRP